MADKARGAKTMGAKHAPGPWGVDEGPNWIVIDSETRDDVAGIPLDDSDEDALAETRANARLIAAAPCLLAACKHAKKYLDDMGLAWLGKGPDPLEAAISKAEG